jgi:recombination protein RecA
MLSTLPLGWRHADTPDYLPTGIHEADVALHGCPRGRITEIIGPSSSGRTSVLHSILAAATSRQEFAVLLDAHDAFDLCSASAAGVQLSQLIWIRCGGNVEHALRAADLVIHSGGFGVVALDLADASDSALSRIPATTWFRFRRAVETTPTVLAVIARKAITKSCSAMLVEMKRRRALFTGNLLRGVDYEIAPRKPIGKEQIALHRAAV